jgi:hypothetical protein
LQTAWKLAAHERLHTGLFEEDFKDWFGCFYFAQTIYSNNKITKIQQQHNKSGACTIGSQKDYLHKSVYKNSVKSVNSLILCLCTGY